MFNVKKLPLRFKFTQLYFEKQFVEGNRRIPLNDFKYDYDRNAWFPVNNIDGVKITAEQLKKAAESGLIEALENDDKQ